MPPGSLQFTPRQLLDAGRRAEAEGRLDLALKFYGHLSDHYPLAPEASEGRLGLGRIGAGGARTDVWQGNSTAHDRLPSMHRARSKRTPARMDYRVGRALAAILGIFGWLAMAAAVLALAAAGAGELALVAVPQRLTLGREQLMLAAGAFLGGAMAILLGQLAKASFDQANAMQELVVLERLKASDDRL
jgi:hypothetical protein